MGREVTREHGRMVQKIKGACKTYPGGTKGDGTAGGGLASLGWGCRWVCGGLQMCQEQERYERVCEEAKRRPGTPGWLVTRWSVWKCGCDGRVDF